MAQVLHLITRYLDGGAETTTKNAVQALNESDLDYEARLGTGAEHDPERLQELEAETVVFRFLRHYNPFTAILAVFSVAWYLRREEIDAIHTHSTEAGIIGRWAGHLAGTPVIIHEIHGDPITSDRNPVLNWAILNFERATAPLADCLIVKSERIRETFLERGIGRPSQYQLIYHGVNIDKFKQADTDLGHSPAGLLFVGRLTEGKGLYDLLCAIDSIGEARLDIVGDGPLYEPLAAEVEKRNLSKVTLHGYREDIPLLMAHSDILVLPSYREGTPRVITEAMAAGLPVIATDIAGIPEQVANGETGFLFSPGDTEKLAAHIQTLLENPELRDEFGQKAQERVHKFDVETAKGSYQSLYKNLL